MMPGPQAQPPPNPGHTMPPPPQPQPQQAGRPQPPGESPSLANAQPPTPTPGNKTIPAKGKQQKDGGRAKRVRQKAGAAPATPNASEPPTPTTPITPHAPVPFNQANQPPANQSQSQPPQQQAQPPPTEQPPPQNTSQELAPTAFGAIDHAGDADPWPNTVDEKNWMSNLNLEFSGNFNGSLPEFPNSGFNPMMGEDETVNYSDFLNDGDAMGIESFNMWGDELAGAGTEV